MCVLEREDTSAKGEKKKHISKGKKGSQMTLLQYGSVKNLVNICLHCTGVSCEGEASS